MTIMVEAQPLKLLRHRLSRAGDRQLNSCLHIMAITKSATKPPDVPTTSANAPPAKATGKHCDA
ncbi:MAG TPA: hypothetical protein VE196_04615 [Pseudonocardiaceae bacterium]|nr:hypothetical protein [Pseudonocardiaceae bacterium]